MIYLIGGAPRTGKTTLSLKILKKNISCLSTDAIRVLLDKSPANIGIIDSEWNKRPEAFFPYLFQLLKILQNRYDNYVIEGDIFTPKQVSEMSDRINLKCCFLGTSSTTLEKIKKVSETRDWVSNKTPEEQDQIVPLILKASEFFKVESEKYGFEYFDVSDDRDQVLQEAYSFLIN